MKKYKIGTAAKQSGVSPQTIRFYESRDLIRSYKEEMGTTRYYGVRHFKQLANIRRYYKQGFSEDEVRRLTGCTSLAQMEALYDMRAAQCEQELLQIASRLRSIRAQLKDLRRAPALYGQIALEESPTLHFLITRRGDEMDESPQVEAVLTRWVEHIHLIRPSSVIPKDAFVQTPTKILRHSGYCVSPEDLARMGMHPGEAGIYTEASRRCLHTVCALRGEDISPMALMPQVYAYLEAHALRVSGDVFGRCIAVLDEQKNSTGRSAGEVYYDYWIPVEDA